MKQALPYLLVAMLLAWACGCSKTEKGKIGTDADYDAYIDEGTPSDNYGLSATLKCGVDSSGNQRQILFWFDHSWFQQNLPKGAKITKVVLKIYVTGVSGGGGGTFYLAEVDESWSETSVTWNNRPSKSPSLFSFTGPTQSGWYEISDSALKALVQDWLAGYTNYGICIYPSYSLSQGTGFSCSSVEGVSTNHPKLIVYYEEKK